jgi:hypothetical protein
MQNAFFSGFFEFDAGYQSRKAGHFRLEKQAKINFSLICRAPP